MYYIMSNILYPSSAFKAHHLAVVSPYIVQICQQAYNPLVSFPKGCGFYLEEQRTAVAAVGVELDTIQYYQ